MMDEENKYNGRASLSHSSDETVINHDEPYHLGAVTPPIYESSLFSFTHYGDLLARYQAQSAHPIYSRVDNPTVKVFEDKMAELEGAEAALAFGSGMAAISNAILGVVKAGDHIVCVNHVYADTYRFIRGVCAKFGVTCEFVDGTDLEALEILLSKASLLYLESPSSWVMQEQDLVAISCLARKYHVITMIDNTCATPIYQKPLLAGIDIVLHSASKYICGHSDVVAGVVVSNKATIDNIRNNVSVYLGAKLSAHEASLLVRGLRTLPIRMKQHNNSGLLIANRLSKLPEVFNVYHPGINRKHFSQMSGYGSLFSILLDPHIDIETFVDSLRIFKLGVSWGGFESLVLPSAPSLMQSASYNPSRDFGVPANLVRLYIGLEGAEELWNDLLRAFEQCKQGRIHEQ